MSVGDQLRQTRLKQGRTLSAVAREAGLSKGFLSQVEGGATNASLASLRRLAHVLSVPVSTLVQDTVSLEVASLNVQPVVVRHRSVMPMQSSLSAVSPVPAGTIFNASMRAGAYLESAPESSREAQKSGTMYCIMLAGDVVEFTQGDTALRLSKGDSLTWAANRAWKLRNAGAALASLLLFVSPASDVPSLVEGSFPSLLPAQLLTSHRPAGVSEGPLKLVAMRAARGGRVR